MSKSILPSCVVSFGLIPYLASPVNVGKGPLPTKREAKGSTGICICIQAGTREKDVTDLYGEGIRNFSGAGVEISRRLVLGGPWPKAAYISGYKQPCTVPT